MDLPFAEGKGLCCFTAIYDALLPPPSRQSPHRMPNRQFSQRKKSFFQALCMNSTIICLSLGDFSSPPFHQALLLLFCLHKSTKNYGVFAGKYQH
jgi:hypothetical protein